MRKSLLFITIITLAILAFGINGLISNSSSPEREKPKFDTRIDNIHYWVKMAEKGLTPFNPDVKVKTAIYTGSRITALSVRTEDSPDVPVTEINSTQSENSVFLHPAFVETVLNSNNSTSWPVEELYGSDDLHSFDGGETWEGSVEGAGGDNRGDPTTAIGLNGRWYINYISPAGGQGISYSDDEGETWATQIIAPNPGEAADKNHMWIDNSPKSTFEGSLYAAWTDFGGPNYGNIALSYSNDNAENWSPIANISSETGGLHQGVHIQTGPEGQVYAFFSIYDDQSKGGMNAIGMSRSVDGGENWTTIRIIENIRGARESSLIKGIRANDFPVSAVDISEGIYKGNLYVTWANIGYPGENTGFDIDIYMIRSENEGLSWSDPIRINQDPAGEEKIHFFPWITCDPTTGSLSAIFYDDRNVGESELETWCANSMDAGNTWEDFKVSDVSFTPSPIPGLASNYMGDYLGIAARDGYVYPTFTDNRSGAAMTYCSPYRYNSLNFPKNLTGNVEFETGNANLQWTFEEAENFKFFNIYRDEVLINTTTDTTYTDPLQDYGYYYYKVTAAYDGEFNESSASGIQLQWGDAFISIEPESIHEKLVVDSSSQKYIEVVNTGQLPLLYSISTLEPQRSHSMAYCEASGTGDAEYIQHVSLGSINNSSGATGYSDFTLVNTLLDAGKSYELTVVIGEFYLQDQCIAWIDWDNNEEFDEELISCERLIDETNPDTTVFKATVSVPPGSVSGATRLRIRLMYTGDPEPCGNTIWGEVEDYTVIIQNWFKINPVYDTLVAGEKSIITVDFNSTDIVSGLYAANAIFYSNDPINDASTVPITLEVVETMIAASTEPSGRICAGEQFNLFATPYGSFTNPAYTWTSVPEGFTSNEQFPQEIIAETSTLYKLEMKTDDGIFYDSVYLEVLSVPDVNLGVDTTICGNLEWVLDAGPDGKNYLWSTGETTRMITIDTSTLYNGYGDRNISVQVTNEDGCSNNDNVTVTYVNCTGINEHMNRVSVSVFPNPGDGYYQLDLTSFGDDEVSIVVFDQSGSIIYRRQNVKIRENKSQIIDIKHCSSGLYRLFVIGKNRVATKKLVKF